MAEAASTTVGGGVVGQADIGGEAVDSTDVHDFGSNPGGIEFPVVVACPECGHRTDATMTFERGITRYVCDNGHKWTR